jgi:hypothetical protein
MQIGQKTLHGPSHGESLATHEKYLEELNIMKERVEEYLAHSIPEIRLEQEFRAANCETIANTLSKEDALVEFIRFDVWDFLAVPYRGESFWKPSHYVALIMLGKEPNNIHMIDLGDAEKINGMVADFIDSITFEARHNMQIPKVPRRDTLNRGSALRKTILDPLKNVIGERKTLFLSPDGELTRLPFEVLPIGKEGDHWLVDDYDIGYLSSGRDIMRFAFLDGGSYAYPLVAVDPDFDIDYNDKISRIEEISTSNECPASDQS